MDVLESVQGFSCWMQGTDQGQNTDVGPVAAEFQLWLSVLKAVHICAALRSLQNTPEFLVFGFQMILKVKVQMHQY